MSATLKKVLAPLPATKRGSNVLLGGDPKGKNLLYCCGSSVIIRDVEDPSVSDMYNDHPSETTVARYAPSGFYICSGDIHGNIKIWDTTNTEHLLKYEYRPLSGPVKDLAWSDDSKRIVLCGDGREKFGAAILWDTGSNVGEISGHSKAINSIDIKQTRPYRVATAGEDNESAFFQGPPFKYQFSNKDHTRFVQVVRFAPDGSVYVTGSSDGKIFIYDGKTGEKKGELGSPAHKGTVMAVAWGPDSKQLLSVSADKTAKLWNVEANECTTEFTFGDDIDAQQMGCAWVGDNIITLSLAGYLNYLDPASPSKPKRVIQGHNKVITALAVSADGSHLYTGDYSGRMVAWDLATGAATTFLGNGHTNQINGIATAADGSLVTVAMDDTVMSSPAQGSEWSGNKQPTESCPMGLGVGGNVTAIACVNGIEIHRDGSRVVSKAVDWDPLCASVSGDGRWVAVGGKDSKLHLFEFSGDALKEAGTVDCKGQVHCCAFFPDSSLLATGDSGRNVLVFSVPDLEIKMSGWVFHNARVNSLAWSPSGKHIVSGGLDTNIFVWSMENRIKRIAVKNAHVGSVTQVAWINDTTVVSTGQDAAVKIWDVTHH